MPMKPLATIVRPLGIITCFLSWGVFAQAAMGHDLPTQGQSVRAQSEIGAIETLHDAWQVYTVGEGTKPSFDFDSSGRIHVMGMTEAEPGVVWYSVGDSVGATWTPQNVRSGYFYGPGDLRVDRDDVAHLAWHNHDQEDPNHLSVSPNGTQQYKQIASPGHNGWDNSLAIGPNGRLYQASINPREFGATNSLEFGEFDGNEWTYQAIPNSGDFSYGMNTSVAIDGSNRAHILFCQCDGFTAPGELQYARQTANGWDISTVASGGIAGRFPTLALDENDVAHATWVDVDSSTTRGTVRYGKLVGGSWQVETVDSVDNIQLGFGGARKLVSLAIDQTGDPHIAYGDQQNLVYAHRADADDWEQTTVLESSSNLYNGHVVLRLDEADDAPTVVFWQPDVVGSGTVRVASPIFQPIQPGDSNRDGQFDQRDLFQVLRSRKFRSGEAATWEDGDWNGAPAGRLARPPRGDGEFNNQDVVAALAANQWLAGPYATSATQLAGSGSQLTQSIELLYDSATGSMRLDTGGNSLSSIDLVSLSGIFAGDTPAVLSGEFDNDTDGNLFKATFGFGFQDLDFGNVADSGLDPEFLSGDLSITGSFADGGFVEQVAIRVVPEPTSLALLLPLLAWTVVCCRNRRAV